MRVSTREQTVAAQLDALRKVEYIRIFEETASGANHDRPPPGHHAPGPIQAPGGDYHDFAPWLGRGAKSGCWYCLGKPAAFERFRL